jgi:hypothetical protein
LRYGHLAWLRAELEARRRLRKEGAPKACPPVPLELRHWLTDRDFDGVRGAEALARLPAAERQEWRKLWADLADTVARAE